MYYNDILFLLWLRQQTCICSICVCALQTGYAAALRGRLGCLNSCTFTLVYMCALALGVFFAALLLLTHVTCVCGDVLVHVAAAKRSVL